MFSENQPTIVNKRMSFLSVCVLCLTSVVITLVVSAAGLGVYGLRIVDRKSDNLAGLVGQISEKLPELRDSLPPALLDAMDDERRPDYLSSLKVSVKLVGDEDHRRRTRAVVEIENKGDETISLMTMRIVAMDKNGEPISERRTWAASPLQLDGDWRGPLMPHETRRFTLRHFDADEAASVTSEVTELRVWCGYEKQKDAEAKGLVALGKMVSQIVTRD